MRDVHAENNTVKWLLFLQEEAYSLESSKELLEKDVVQLHAPRWQSMRKVGSEKQLRNVRILKWKK